MPGLCCVPNCDGRGGHRFPTKGVQRSKWIQAVKRGEPGWKPSKYSTVCRAHFADTDYKMETKEKDEIQNRILKEGVVPHLFAWNVPVTASQASRQARGERKRKLMEVDDHMSLHSYGSVGNEVEICSTILEEDTCATEVMMKELPTCVDSFTQTNVCPGFTASEYMFEPQKFHFYTGLETYDTFRCLFLTFGDCIEGMTYFYKTIPRLPLEDQFYLTLVKLRTAKANFELSCLFKISEKEVVNIFVTWINFLYHHFKDIDWWPSRELVRFFSPSDFKAKFPTTRVIIDGTEIPLKKPRQPAIQQATFSSYKNRNTVKVLVGISPGGLVSYVSDAYGGAASDRQICERSDLTTKCDSGDSIMADKGFNVQDMFIPSNVVINIPEFFKKKNRMSATSVTKDRKIASKRVHVERLIGLAKTFKILKQPLNNTESNLADAIISVCFYLCNFRGGIVSADC